MERGRGLTSLFYTIIYKAIYMSILKEISPEYSLESVMLKLKLPILWPPDAKNWLIGKDPDAGKGWRQEEKGMTEDDMVGRHHQLYGHEFEQAPGVGDGQGRLACCGPWRCKESDTTELLNWTENLVKHNEEWGTSQVALVVKNLPASAGNAGDRGLIPGSGRSPGVGNGNRLQYSCLENSMDRGAWWATVHGAANSWTWLSDWIDW